MNFDIVRDFAVKDVLVFLDLINMELISLHLEYHYVITPDLDINDIEK